MAIQLGTTVTWRAGGDWVRLTSNEEAEPADIPLPSPTRRGGAALVRDVAGMVVKFFLPSGEGAGTADHLLVGAGCPRARPSRPGAGLGPGFAGELLSSWPGRCQRAEQFGLGVPCGLMDQLAAARRGVDGHALLIDLLLQTAGAVAIPPGCE